MMNKITAIALMLLSVATMVQAQLPAGSQAPDFTAQDINGQQHHLYDYLNSNRIVLLEISATWCPPCWAYHQTQALEKFYQLHGPSGDDKARVIWVEGDPNTGIACIYGQAGCSQYSPGNYTTGISYPMINSSTIASSFQITYFPTLFIICPNKRVYEVDPLDEDGLWKAAQQCPVAYGENNAGIFAHDPGYKLPEICHEVQLAPSFLMTNLGSSPLTSAEIITRWNGNNLQTIQWTGHLETFEEALIRFDTFSVDAAGEMNTIISSINNNAGDADFTNNYKNNIYLNSKHFDETQIVLKIRTDNYGHETYWELHDEAGNMLDHGGNQAVGIQGGGAFPLGVDHGPGSYPSNTLIKDTLYLPGSGCYSIHFVDAYGDGMCCEYGNGYYKLYNINDPVNPIISAGQYEGFDSHAFSAGMESSPAPELSRETGFRVYPNPADDMVYIEGLFPANEPMEIRVINAVGQVVIQSLDATPDDASGLLKLSVKNLENGFYFLSMKWRNNQVVAMKKIMVQH